MTAKGVKGGLNDLQVLEACKAQEGSGISVESRAVTRSGGVTPGKGKRPGAGRSFLPAFGWRMVSQGEVVLWGHTSLVRALEKRLSGPIPQ